jgi:hypothetical protein
MIVCELCSHYQGPGECKLDLKIPKGMSCCEFCPVIEMFCSNPTDFESSGQIIQMATFFGMKGSELKKVKTMALREESTRR